MRRSTTARVARRHRRARRCRAGAAVTTVTSANGLNWQIHDIAPPKLDTGSIRAISDNAFYGFGGIRVRVSGIPATDTSARLNGELMRGFGLAFDGDDSFATEAPIVLGGVAISRDVKVSKAGNWTRWMDTFANTTQRTITVDVAFGGTAGQNTGTNQSIVRHLQRRHADRRRRHLGRGRQPVGHRRQLARPVRRRARHPAGTGNFQRDPFGNALPAPAWRPTSTATRTR